MAIFNSDFDITKAKWEVSPAPILNGNDWGLTKSVPQEWK